LRVQFISVYGACFVPKTDSILVLTRMHMALVQVLKHEWPARWPRFIPDLVSAAKSSESLCENCMVILKV
jgi:exportin-1